MDMKPLTDEQAQRIADRRNQKDAEENPLFAHLLPPVTPEMVKEFHRRHWESFRDTEKALEAYGAYLRAALAREIAPEDLTALDKRRAVLPPTGEYTADFWRRVFEERGIPLPEIKAADFPQAPPEL